MNGKSKAGGERGGGREKEGDEGGGGRAAKRNERRGDRRETMRRERKLCKLLDNVFFVQRNVFLGFTTPVKFN